MEWTAVAAKTLPALAGGNGFDLVRFGGDADGEMGRPIAARLLLHKASAVGAARLQLRSGGVDLDTRSVFVKLQREKASWVGRKWHRLPSH